MATYALSSFLATPAIGDVRLKIYDKTNKLRHTIDPNIAYFFKKANIVVIKVEDKNEIYLDFATATESGQALSKLNDAKKALSNTTNYPPTNTVSESIFSKANLNMSGLVTVNDGNLACSVHILDKPIATSYVRVFVNGVEVNVGGKTFPHDCYFSSDNGLSAKILGDEKQGDLLFWNQSVAGYNLDTIDLIDFVYLINTI